MKFKTTRKAIVSGTSPLYLVKAGYCELQTLLRFHDPIAYTAGVYGWNFDVFEVYGLTICTGYRNMPGRHANNCGEYEERAREIMESATFSNHEETREKMENLLREFCEQA